MRCVNEIILHCTDTESNVKPEVIRNYHVNVLGWKDCGYHFLIALDGSVYPMRSVSHIGAHCYGHNRGSIGIAYIGRSASMLQLRTMALLCYDLCKEFPTICKISKHCDYNSKKTCPNMTSEDFERFQSYLNQYKLKDNGKN